MFRSCCVLFCLVLPCAAQVSSGSLVGDALDEKSGFVPGVQITVRSAATGFTRTAQTTDRGNYRIDELIPGAYSVVAEKNGFHTVHAANVVVEVNQKTRLDLQLLLGPVSEQVTVSAPATALQTDEASEGYTLDSDFIRALPMPNRHVISLVTLGPGAIPRQLGGFVHDIMNDLQAGRGSVELNPPVNGARSSANSYILDGADNTDRNIFAIVIAPPLESVAEFRIQSSLAPAEFRQSGGAVVDVVTKSGGRVFHGNAFEFFQNEAIDAKGFFEVPGLPRGVFRQNQYGATLGGPVKGNTFFFATYEGLRGKSASASQHMLPEAGVRAGDFTGRNLIYDPLSTDSSGNRTPFPGNIIPSSRIDPIARRYLDTYEPLPNLPGNPSGNYVDSTPNHNQTDSGTARIDHAWGARSQLFGRYTINDERTLLAGAFPERPTSESLRAQQAALGQTFSGPSWVSELRLAFTRLRVFDLPLSAFGANVSQQLGIQGLSSDPFTYGLPALVVTDFDMVQDANTLPQLQRDNNLFSSASFSRTSGRHTWKTGFQFTHFTMAYLQSQYVRGQYQFNGTLTQDPQNPGATGDAFADFLLGFPEVTRRDLGTAQAYLRNNTWAAYVQDDWQLARRLTLSLGVRYEYVSPFTEDGHNLLNLDYAKSPAQPVLQRVNSAQRPDRNNFSPRIGLAARLPRNSVFRAGYGVYYSPEIAEESYDLLRNGVRTEINEPASNVPVLTLANGFTQTGSTGLPSYFGVDSNPRTPYVQQWSASLQHEAPGRVLVELAYIGTKGTDLGLFRRFNTPAHVEIGQDLAPRPGDLQSLRTWPDLGTLFQLQHIGNSIYHSLQIKAEKRMTHGLSFLSSFVWAKSIDDSDSIVPGQFESFGAQDERNLHLERGLSFFDVRRRFTAGFVYSIPRLPVWRPLFSNWQTSGTIILQDGTPLNPVYFATDFANSGTPNRPNVVPGQSVSLPSSQRSADRFFNTAAFSDPAPFTFGNAGRDIIPGPGNEVVDLALHRRFRWRENLSVEVRAESFNLFNHPNIGIPGPYPDFGPFFGKAFSAGDPRRFQFGVRIDF